MGVVGVSGLHNLQKIPALNVLTMPSHTQAPQPLAVRVGLYHNMELRGEANRA